MGEGSCFPELSHLGSAGICCEMTPLVHMRRESPASETTMSAAAAHAAVHAAHVSAHAAASHHLVGDGVGLGAVDDEGCTVVLSGSARIHHAGPIQ